MSCYLQDILTSARRVMTLQDRNPLGPTKGLFTRSYWHFRTTDFPSASDQMALGILAKLWRLEESEYFHNSQVLQWSLSAIDALAKMQKDDGSFDEWYFNERGWAGPTGYVMNAALDAYQDLKDALPPASKQTLLEVIHKGINFLKKSNEGHMLANHVAIVILPLIQAKHLLGMKDLDPFINELIKKLYDVWHPDEGWSTEYDGADPGYQSGTLSFLSKTLQYEENEKLEEVCKRSLEFISHFAFPSGAVGGALGSRHTVTFFCSGIEAFRESPMGARLSLFLEEGFRKGSQVLGSDLDDHYLIYRLYELLDAHFFSLKKPRHPSPELLPWEREEFRRSFPLAGFEIGVKENIYWASSLKRGGVVRIEDRFKKEVLLLDSGIIAVDGGKTLTSLWQGTYDIRAEGESFQVKGSLVDVTPKIFNPLKLIIFRLFCLLTGFHHAPSLWTKNFIRKLMMVNNVSSKHAFSRFILITDDHVSVETHVFPSGELQEVCIGGEFWSRYVPQSRHFLKEHLTQSAPYERKASIRSQLTAVKKVRYI